jgi:uncharacterized protein YfiM (DUF2279 family)
MIDPNPHYPEPMEDLTNQSGEGFWEPEAIEDGEGGVEFTFGEEAPSPPEFSSNLAEHMDDAELASLAGELVEQYEGDERSRAGWLDTYVKGLDLLGLKFEKRTEPWDGACGVFHPLLTDSIVRFQAQTIQEIFPASGPVKVSVVGTVNTERTQQATRVAGFMNYVATKKMKEYRTETERLLFSLPISGSAFRKIYFDPNLGRPASMFVPAEDFCVNYGASDLSTCGRATHIMRKTANDIRKLQVSGFYLDIDLDEPAPETSDIKDKINELTGTSEETGIGNAMPVLLEMHVEVDLVGFEDEDEFAESTGIALPYVITIDKSSQQILSIYRNWLEEDTQKLKREHISHYTYLPGLGFYGFGLVHMIGGLTQSATSILRQLIDAGTLSNLPGGLKTKGLRIKGDDTPIRPGEFRDVDVPGGTIGQNIEFLPHKEPSSVLYQLLGDLVTEGRRFASAADMKVSDMNGESPVGTTLALLEKEMKVISAVQARVHASMNTELTILADIIKDFGPENYPYEVGGKQTVAEDFDERVDILPVSDPNAGTMAQRILQYQSVLQLSQSAPQIYDIPRLHRQMIEAIGLEEADKIIPMEDDLMPTDPVTETMNLLNGKPVKAHLGQDHESHIAAHMAAAEHPKLKEMMAQHPNAKGVMGAAGDHLAEHLGFLYRKQVEEELGTQMPHPDEPLPDDVELKLSKIVAQAAAQLTGKAQQQQQAEENAKQQEDPILLLKKEEMRLKDEKIKSDERKSKIANDTKLKGAELMVEAAGDQLNADEKAEQRLSKEQLEGYRMGLQTAQQIMQRKFDLQHKGNNQ